jgi:uncharacterized protein (TIGR03545 family)
MSGPEREPSPPPSSGDAAGKPASPAPVAKPVRVIRWQGLVPLLLVGGLAVLAWRLALPRVLASVASEALTKALGTQVDVDGVTIALREARVQVARLQVADPFDTTHNIVEAGPITLELDGAALLEKKAIIDSLVVADARWRTARPTPARAVTGPSFARDVLAEARRFAAQLRVPPLELLPLDTVRSLVLDPGSLATVTAARALERQADSIRTALTAGVSALDVRPVIDSGEALLGRLQKASPRSLGLAGTQQAVRDVRAMQRRIEDVRRTVDSLIARARAGGDSLRAGLRRVDDARRTDYAFARSLLKLPTFEGPDFSGALFGPVSIARFEQAVYYAKLAERWVPPGLLPREADGPQRVRMSGTTVHFPKAQQYPRLLLKRGEVRLAMRDDAGRPAAYRVIIGDVTTEPALVGRPIVALARRDAAAATGLATLDLRATIDHLGDTPRDSVAGTASGIALPELPLPGLPLRLIPGAGTSALTFVRRGEGIAARFALRAPRVTWRADSAALGGRNALERVAVEALSGIPELTLTADLGGTFAAPTLRVSSNLDQAIAARLRAMLGAEVARAEARARAAVDAEVTKARAVVQAKVDEATTQAQAQLDEARTRLDAARAKLDERLRGLTGGLVGLPPGT